MARRLGLGLIDEELDLLDLALDLAGLRGQARGEIRGRGGTRGGLEQRVGRGPRLDAGLRGDLSPPAS
ncbi:MAG TPA: hypothetical protein VJ850_01250 [Candidatus Limnocylindrales bacterium]|nr:hypothetical protein [Candidatus Limnocylindrales bacterium]